MTLNNLPSFRGYLREVYRAIRQPARADALPPVSSPIFAGDFSSWKDAAAGCDGYDAEEIFNKTKAAALAVRDGRASFERDSVTFDRAEYRWEPLAAMLWQAACDRGELRVLDFGGSLGSVYFQSRAYLADLPLVRWGVVEQSHYVDFGRRELGSDSLQFFPQVQECWATLAPNVAFFGGVLQYLTSPYEVLDGMLSYRPTSVIFDKLALVDQATDRLTIQRVPKHIYEASYPAWFFSEARFLDHLKSAGYRYVSEWCNIDEYPLEGATTAFKGFHFITN